MVVLYMLTAIALVFWTKCAQVKKKDVAEKSSIPQR